MDRITLRIAIQKNSIGDRHFCISLCSAGTVIPILHIIFSQGDLVIRRVHVLDLAVKWCIEPCTCIAVILDALIQTIICPVPFPHIVAKRLFDQIIPNGITGKHIAKCLMISIERFRTAFLTCKKLVVFQPFFLMGLTFQLIFDHLIKAFLLPDVVIEIALRFPVVLFVIAVHTGIMDGVIPDMRIGGRNQKPGIIPIPAPERTVVPGVALHEEKFLCIVVDEVKRFFYAGIIAVIHDHEAGQSIVIVRIQHPVVRIDADIALTVKVLAQFRRIGNGLETIFVWSVAVDKGIFFGSVIRTGFRTSAAPVVVVGKFLPAGFIVIPVDKRIFCIEYFCQQILCVTAIAPILDVAVAVCIKVIVIGTQERPQLVHVKIIDRIPVINGRTSPVPIVGIVFQITLVCSESGKTVFPVCITADFQNLLIHVVGKFCVIFFCFRQVVVLSRICAKDKTRTA